MIHNVINETRILATVGGSTGNEARADKFDDIERLAGSLKGKIVVDTTNPYGAFRLIAFADGVATGERNQRKVPDARVVKAFETCTASFKATSDNPGETAIFISGADAEAKQIVGGLVQAVGFEPADLGGWKTVLLMDAPGPNGAVYGEAYIPSDARKIADLEPSCCAKPPRKERGEPPVVENSGVAFGPLKEVISRYAGNCVNH